MKFEKLCGQGRIFYQIFSTLHNYIVTLSDRDTRVPRWGKERRLQPQPRISPIWTKRERQLSWWSGRRLFRGRRIQKWDDWSVYKWLRKRSGELPEEGKPQAVQGGGRIRPDNFCGQPWDCGVPISKEGEEGDLDCFEYLDWLFHKTLFVLKNKVG